MFEKEAEEYRLNLVLKLKEKIQKGYNCKELIDIEKAFQKGAEFAYNKGNEWSYPSKGEYPKENKRYLCKIKTFVGGGISYECFDYDTEYVSWKSACGDIIAWREIPTSDKE